MRSLRLPFVSALCCAAFLSLVAAADDGPPPLKGAALGEGDAYYLDVFVNERAVGLIAAFQRGADGRFTIAPDELEQVGLKADAAALGAGGAIELERLPGVVALYDEKRQQMRFSAGAEAMLPHRVDAAPVLARTMPPPVRDTGAVVNYTLYASGRREDGAIRRNDVSALLEARGFGPFGVLSGAAIARRSGREGWDWRRLDTTWRWSDPGGPTSYLAGDVVSGALSWTRPGRLGGIQIRRNFGLRPDMVTQPLAELRGSADVPSTVEVFVDGARRASADVPAGPFEISNLPLVTGPSLARVVVRDALGRERVTESSFFSSGRLLAEGLFDFSAEIGMARLDFAGETDAYDRRVFASGSLRYGFSDALTLEAHAEGGGGLIMGGAGFAAPLGSDGVLTFAAATSRYDGRSGTSVQGTLDLALGSVRFLALSQRNTDGFADIASVSALEGAGRPPRGIDQASLSFPDLWPQGSLTFSYARLDRRADGVSEFASASLTATLPGDALFFASAFADLGGGAYGLFAGLTLPLNGEMEATASVEADRRRIEPALEMVRAEAAEPGGYGWRVRVSEDSQAVRAAYRAGFARLEGTLWRENGTMQGAAQMEGALAFAGGALFAAPRIDDAFAVVDAGAAGVPVTYENRPAGTTDGDGQLLVQGLRAYERNRIAIDPAALPVAAVFGETVREAVPQEGGVAVMDFGVDQAPRAALVSLLREDGTAVPAGATAVLAASGARFAVGYDGQVYVTDLNDANRLEVIAPDGTMCAATFAFPDGQTGQVRIAGVPCRTGGGT